MFDLTNLNSSLVRLLLGFSSYMCMNFSGSLSYCIFHIYEVHSFSDGLKVDIVFLSTYPCGILLVAIGLLLVCYIHLNNQINSFILFFPFIGNLFLSLMLFSSLIKFTKKKRKKDEALSVTLRID